MYLNQLLVGLKCTVLGNSDVNVTSLACDTREVKQGSLFFCLKGSRYDGHDFFRKALGDGAVALVTEKQLDTTATQIVVDDSRQTMSLLAKNFFGRASDKLKIVSVVGTNGKTSTTYVLDAFLKEAGFSTAVVGTNGVFVNGKRYTNNLTTPDPITLHRWFEQFYLNKVQFVIMEVSAHAIALRKLQGVQTDVAVFTNFSQDHLDFFKTMQNYGDTKKSFFCSKYCKNAVINVDDDLGKQIANETDLPFVTYSAKQQADVCASEVFSDNPVKFKIDAFGQSAVLESNLSGFFNVYNVLAATSVAMLFGVSIENVCKALAKISYIEGRNETFFRSDGARVVVDFAHTPDGITNILSYLKSTTKGKLIVVFGCGGNRDKFKRPLMANVVSRYADFAVVTNDNPRFEDPLEIAKDVENGMTCDYKVILNRSQATEFALSVASCDDTVAVLGKGAERYQDIKGRKYPYSDIDVVTKLLRRIT